MNYQDLGSSYSLIGDYLLQCAPDKRAPIFLYAEAEPGVMGEGVYQDRGHDIIYLDCEPGLSDLLFSAWNAEKRGKRWTAMELLVKDGHFSARFSYQKFEEFDGERELNALHRHLGNKPVFYPDPSFEERWESLDPANFPSENK